MIFVRKFLHAENDVAIHLDEASVAVPSKTLVVRNAGKSFDGFVVQTEVQNRVHHARHRLAGAGAHGNKKREPGSIAEFFAELLFNVGNGIAHVRHERFRISLFVFVIIRADFRADCETRRHRQADARHFSEVGAFPAK